MSIHDRLTGQATTSLDAEGRMLIAKAHRDVLAAEGEELDLAATLEPNGCVALRHARDWERRLERIEALPETSHKQRLLAYLAGHSAPVRMDKQGRVRVPDWLLDKADLARDAGARRELVFVGVGSHLEVWAPERRRAWEAQARADFAATWDGLLSEGLRGEGSSDVRFDGGRT